MSTRPRGRPPNPLRQAARERGHRTFARMEPCPVCDGVEFYTSNAGCVACGITRGRARYSEHREQISEYDRLQYASLSPNQRERLLENRRAQRTNMSPEDREREQLNYRRREWVIRRLLRMARDDGVYAALKVQYHKRRPQSPLRDWVCRRLVLLARDDGVFDILMAQSLEANLEK